MIKLPKWFEEIKSRHDEADAEKELETIDLWTAHNDRGRLIYHVEYLTEELSMLNEYCSYIKNKPTLNEYSSYVKNKSTIKIIWDRFKLFIGRK